jgi:molybdopterin synthase catalytic subunit
VDGENRREGEGMNSIRVDVKLFAVLRDRAGVAGLTLDLPAESTAAAAGRILADRFPGLRQHLPATAYAVNRSYAGPAHVLNDGDELALIPPVSGG